MARAWRLAGSPASALDRRACRIQDLPSRNSIGTNFQQVSEKFVPIEFLTSGFLTRGQAPRVHGQKRYPTDTLTRMCSAMPNRNSGAMYQRSLGSMRSPAPTEAVSSVEE